MSVYTDTKKSVNHYMKDPVILIKKKSSHARKIGQFSNCGRLVF